MNCQISVNYKKSKLKDYFLLILVMWLISGIAREGLRGLELSLTSSPQFFSYCFVEIIGASLSEPRIDGTSAIFHIFSYVRRGLCDLFFFSSACAVRLTHSTKFMHTLYQNGFH